MSSSTPSGGAPIAPASDIELPGVDTSSLTPRERREWSAYVSERLAPCSDTPVSIAQCIKEKRNCSRCLPAAKFLVKEVRDGRTKEQVSDGYKSRFDAERIKNIDLADTPAKGPATAPVTIVEWADFECPFCKRAAPIIESMVERFPGKVRFLFKVYPLAMHQHAEAASKAAFAAQNQGKFWEMHHKLFERAPALEDPELDKIAKEVGLDMKQFKADAESAAVKTRIERDKKQGEAVGLEGTPYIFINGRVFDAKGGDFQADLEDWIRVELDLVGQSEPEKPRAPAPAPTVSAAKP